MLTWPSEAALRYHLASSLAVHVRERGFEENDSHDDVVYELGFRFNLSEPQ